jgi:hypothetical protein
MKITLAILFTTLLFIDSSFSKDIICNVVDFRAVNDGEIL